MFKHIYIIALLIVGLSSTSWAQTNDPCTASALPVGTNCSSPTAGSLNGFSINGSITNCASSGDPQGFYTFVATDASMTIEVAGSATIDVVIDLLVGSCGSLTNVACEDNSFTGDTEIMNATGLTIGTTYTIAIYDFFGDNDASATFSVCVYGVSGSGGSTPGGGLCSNVEPICTSTGVQFTANNSGTEAETLEPGNDYGCLTSSPDPAWYYLDIGVAGNIDMTLSAPNDVDFALWGPFPNLAAAQASCGALAAPIDCSYNSSNTEDVNIAGGQVGEVYILLITNYDGSVQLVNLNQTGGTGATNCAAVCGVDAGTTTTTMSNTNSNDHYLCPGESVDISTTGFTLPTATDIAGLGYFIYTDLPTVADPDLEPNWTGYYYTGSAVTETNSAANAYNFILANPSPSAGSNGVPANNQLIFIPITMDDIANIAGGGADDNLGHDIDNDGCYDIGDPITVTYLNPIADAITENCGSNVVITLSGGYPEFVPGASYTVTSTGDGTMAQSGAQGQTLTFTGLNTGDTITVNITDDDNGCTHTIVFVTTCNTAAACEADAGGW